MTAKSPITAFAAIAEAANRPPVERPIKSLGDEVVLFRRMSARERDDHDASVMTKGEVDPAKVRGLRQRLLVRTLCDADGQPIAKEADLDKLPAEVIDEMAEISAEINGMRQNSKEEAGKD